MLSEYPLRVNFFIFLWSEGNFRFPDMSSSSSMQRLRLKKKMVWQYLNANILILHEMLFILFYWYLFITLYYLLIRSWCDRYGFAFAVIETKSGVQCVLQLILRHGFCIAICIVLWGLWTIPSPSLCLEKESSGFTRAKRVFNISIKETCLRPIKSTQLSVWCWFLLIKQNIHGLAFYLFLCRIT